MLHPVRNKIANFVARNTNFCLDGAFVYGRQRNNVIMLMR